MRAGDDAEFGLIDAADLVSLLRYERWGNISDLVTSAAELYFMPGTVRLGAGGANLLLVAMGNPLQEHFIADKLGPQHCSVAAGVGALFDFFADEVQRAPEFVRKARLEWIFRLWLEPRRLWRRYVLGNPAFLMRIARQYAMGGRRSG